MEYGVKILKVSFVSSTRRKGRNSKSIKTPCLNTTTREETTREPNKKPVRKEIHDRQRSLKIGRFEN